MNMLIRFIVIIVSWSACISVSTAVPDLKIDFEKLSEASDAVAMVRCVKVTRVPNDEFHPRHYGKYVLLLEAACTFKGNAGRLLRVKHFEDLPEHGAPGNAPLGMFFGVTASKTIRSLGLGETAEVDEFESLHLVFLVKDKNDPEFLIPATGHSSAAQSSYELLGVGVGDRILKGLLRDKKN